MLNMLNFLTEFNQLREYLNESGMRLLYIGGQNCGVCHAVQPKLTALLSAFPGVMAAQTTIEQIPELASELHVLTVPAVLFFVDNKEMWREARFIRMSEIERQISLWSEYYRLF